jgi:hypothetical protein
VPCLRKRGSTTGRRREKGQPPAMRTGGDRSGEVKERTCFTSMRVEVSRSVRPIFFGTEWFYI